MKKTIRSISLILVLMAPLIVASSVNAADKDGRFYQYGMWGTSTCKEPKGFVYVANAYKTNIDLMFTQMLAIRTFVGGFITAYNALTPDTCNLTTGAESEIEVIDQIVEQCRNDMNQTLAQATLAFVRQRHNTRITECSALRK